MTTDESGSRRHTKQATLGEVEALAEKASRPHVRAELTAAVAALHAACGRLDRAVELAELSAAFAREVPQEERRAERARTLVRAATVFEQVRGEGAGLPLLGESLNVIEAGLTSRAGFSSEDRKALERWFAAVADPSRFLPLGSPLAGRAFDLLERMQPDPSVLALGGCARALVSVGLGDRPRELAKRRLARGGLRLLALEHLAEALEVFGDGRLDVEDERRFWDEIREQANDVDKFALPLLHACLQTEPATWAARVQELAANLRSRGFRYAAFFVELAGLERFVELEGADAAVVGFDALFAAACDHAKDPLGQERPRMLGPLSRLATTLLSGAQLDGFTRRYHDLARRETDPNVRSDLLCHVVRLVVERAAPDGPGILEALTSEVLAEVKVSTRENRLLGYQFNTLEQVVDGAAQLGDRQHALALMETIASAARDALASESVSGRFYFWRTLIRGARARNRLGDAERGATDFSDALDRVALAPAHDRVELLEYALTILPEFDGPAGLALARRVVGLVRDLDGIGELWTLLALDLVEKIAPLLTDRKSRR